MTTPLPKWNLNVSAPITCGHCTDIIVDVGTMRFPEIHRAIRDHRKECVAEGPGRELERRRRAVEQTDNGVPAIIAEQATAPSGTSTVETGSSESDSGTG